MNVGSGYGGLTGGGTIIRFFNAEFFAGSGNAYIDGGLIGSTANQLMVRIGGVVHPVGLSAPGAPVIAASATAGKNNGSYSILLTAIRTATGAESSRGAVSNAVSVKNKKIQINSLPAAPVGADMFGVYVSLRGFSTTGPWYHLVDIPVGQALPFALDWFDGEVGRKAPLDYDPPPPCTHCFSIDNVVVAAGCYGGYGLSPSVPGKPEAFPPDTVVFLSPGEAITNCQGSGFDGRVFIACANSFHECVRTGESVAPIMARPIWPSTGFVGHSSWCVVEDTVYGMSGSRGAVRTRGDEVPDSTYAQDVQTFFSDNGFTSQTAVVGFDPHTDAVIHAAGTLAVPFNRSQGNWSTPITLPSAVVTRVTVNGHLLLADGAGNLYQFENGAGGQYYVVPAMTDG